MKFMCFFSPTLVATLEERKRLALVGAAADVRREMDLLAETANPEWFIWQPDQGYAPLEQVKQMLRRFGKEILPPYV